MLPPVPVTMQTFQLAHCMKIKRLSPASAEPSAAHTVELWESVRHTAGFGRGVVRISEIPALAAVQLARLAHVDDEPPGRFGHSSEHRPTT
jgi:hypothetical protein